MLYLIAQVGFCIAGAFVLGLALGWFAWGRGRNRLLIRLSTARAKLNNISDRYAKLSRSAETDGDERREVARDLAEARARLESAEAANERLERELAGRSAELATALSLKEELLADLTALEHFQKEQSQKAAAAPGRVTASK